VTEPTTEQQEARADEFFDAIHDTVKRMTGIEGGISGADANALFEALVAMIARESAGSGVPVEKMVGIFRAQLLAEIGAIKQGGN